MIDRGLRMSALPHSGGRNRVSTGLRGRLSREMSVNLAAEASELTLAK